MKTKNPRNEAFAERLRSLMAKEKITNVALSRYLGIGETRISTYVRGKAEPCFQYLVMIAQYFDVSTDYLLGNDCCQSETPPSGVQDRIGGKPE